MPYIKQDQRKELDPAIDALVSRIKYVTSEMDNDDKAVCGVLNYCLSRLIIKLIKARFGVVKYWIINMICGTLSNVSSEFYRKTATPYEEEKITENGDLPWREIMPVPKTIVIDSDAEYKAMKQERAEMNRLGGSK
jgi:hypothetical protein